MFLQLERYVENMNLRKFNTSEEQMIPNCRFTYKKIRDLIIRNGKIIDENEEEKIYVFTIQSGKLRNEAVVAMGMQEHDVYMVAYAKEGLIKQQTCERALEQMREVLE